MGRRGQVRRSGGSVRASATAGDLIDANIVTKAKHANSKVTKVEVAVDCIKREGQQILDKLNSQVENLQQLSDEYLDQGLLGHHVQALEMKDRTLQKIRETRIKLGLPEEGPIKTVASSSQAQKSNTTSDPPPTAGGPQAKAKAADACAQAGQAAPSLADDLSVAASSTGQVAKRPTGNSPMPSKGAAVTAEGISDMDSPDRWTVLVAPGNCGAENSSIVRYRWRQANGDDSDDAGATLEVRGETANLEVNVSESSVHMYWPSACSGASPTHTLRLPLGFVTDPDNCRAVRRRKVDELALSFPRIAGLPSQVGGLAEALSDEDGAGCIDNFMFGCDAEMVRHRILDMWQAGRLDPGEVEAGEMARVRSDKYLFLEEEQDPAIMRFTTQLDRVVLELVREVPTLKSTKLMRGRPMAAVYGDAGARYIPHYDAVGGDNGRVLTCVLYLNPFWREADGAQLRLWPQARMSLERTGKSREFAPLHGRLVVFLCDSRNLHEVLPVADGNTIEPRVAISCWYYDSDLLPSIAEQEGQLPADAPV